MPAFSITRSAPMCAIPFAPPPDNTTATFLRPPSVEAYALSGNSNAAAVISTAIFTQSRLFILLGVIVMIGYAP